MQLQKDVLKKINTPRTRTKLALALDCTDQTIIRYIKENDDSLTKAASMEVIREELGLEDNDILEKVSVKTD